MDEFWGGFFAGFVVAIIITGAVLVAVAGEGYKQGQIDALNGEIYYQLQKQDDGTTVWIECEGVCAK